MKDNCHFPLSDDVILAQTENRIDCLSLEMHVFVFCFKCVSTHGREGLVLEEAQGE
jgi:hypothetical protein